MIQRIQTLWLLLAAVSSGLLFTVSYYRINNELLNLLNSNYLGAVLAGTSILLSIYTIAVFKKRKLQLNLIWINILANIGLLVTLFLKINEGQQGVATTMGSFRFGAFIPVITTILLLVSRAGIRKDEKLIKSLDRLR